MAVLPAHSKRSPTQAPRSMSVVRRVPARHRLAFTACLIGLTIIGPIAMTSAADDRASDWQIWGSVGYLGNAGRLKESVREAGNLSTWRTAQEIFLTGDIRYGSLGKFAFDLSQLVGNTQSETRDDTEFEVTELYADPLSLGAGSLSFRVGRQRLKWGVMEFFHPIDTLEEPRNPFRARQVIQGLDAIKIAHISSPSWSNSFLAIRDRDEDAARFALRLDTVVDDFDMSAGLITYFHNQAEDRGAASGLHTTRDTQYALFFETAGFVDQLGVFGEAQLSSSRNRAFAFTDGAGNATVVSDSDFSDTAVFRGGVALQYERFQAPAFKIRGEYFYNSGGFDSSESRAFLSAYQEYKPFYLYPHFGEFGWYSRQYAALDLSNLKLADHLKFGSKLAAALDSGAAIFSADLTYSFDNNNGQIFAQYAHFDSFRDTDRFPGETAFLQSDHTLTLYLVWNFSPTGSKR
ncbi:MAG: hypothetical protein WAU60_07955 [Candidatus Competibacter denitrificans]|jgi:hypothetical protein